MKIFNVDERIMWHKDLYLRNSSRELNEEEVKSPDFKNLIKFMFEALYENEIGVGLSAPQVGLMIKLVVIDIKRNGKSPLVLINPSFEPMNNETVDSRETCLSFEGICGLVKRFKTIKVTAKDINFNNISFEADGFLSIVCQHEISHLLGNVHIDNSFSINPTTKMAYFLTDKAIESLYNE